MFVRKCGKQGGERRKETAGRRKGEGKGVGSGKVEGGQSKWL